MIIHAVEKKEIEDSLRLSARVETFGRLIKHPETLWFEVPKKFGSYIEGYSDGMVTSLVLFAMSIGEDIEVKGNGLTREHQFALREYQQYFHFVWPQKYSLVSVHCESREADFATGGVGTSFSGGVDSYFTLFMHTRANEVLSSYQISHAVFVHGFDIELEDQRSFAIASESYKKLMQELGIELICLKTNIRDFVRHLSWEETVGSAMGGVALSLQPLLKKFYIPSSAGYFVAQPPGTAANLDPILSTERFEIIHDGASYERIEKVFKVAHWEPTYENLRVCWEKPDGIINCCECEKCVRTMTALRLAGTLDRYKTFPKPLLSKSVRRILKKSYQLEYAQELLEEAVKLKDVQIERDLKWSILKSRLVGIFQFPKNLLRLTLRKLV